MKINKLFTVVIIALLMAISFPLASLGEEVSGVTAPVTVEELCPDCTVTVNTTRENEDDQTVYYSVLDKDKIVISKFHGDIPKEADPETYINSHKEKYVKEAVLSDNKDTHPPEVTIKAQIEAAATTEEKLNLLMDYVFNK